MPDPRVNPLVEKMTPFSRSRLTRGRSALRPGVFSPGLPAEHPPERKIYGFATKKKRRKTRSTGVSGPSRRSRRGARLITRGYQVFEHMPLRPGGGPVDIPRTGPFQRSRPSSLTEEERRLITEIAKRHGIKTSEIRRTLGQEPPAPSKAPGVILLLGLAGLWAYTMFGK